MATKIRLQRHGKKGYAFYHVVVADSRAPRDGRFIEKLGTYNPNTNPATIDIDFDKTLNWVTTGAEMSDTDRKSTRLNSSHVRISYAVFCLKKKKIDKTTKKHT